MNVEIISKSQFVELIHDVDTDPKGWQGKHATPIIVDFFGTWCPPCKALSPILDELASEYGNRLRIYKVDIDQDPELTALYNIRTVPTLLFAKSTDTAPTLMLGVMSKAELQAKIEELLF